MVLPFYATERSYTHYQLDKQTEKLVNLVESLNINKIVCLANLPVSIQPADTPAKKMITYITLID